MSTNYSNINNPSGLRPPKFQTPAGEPIPAQSKQEEKLPVLIFPGGRDLLKDQVDAVAIEKMRILKKELTIRPKKDWSTFIRTAPEAYKKITDVVNQVLKSRIAMELQRQKIKAIMQNMSQKFQEFLKPRNSSV